VKRLRPTPRAGCRGAVAADAAAAVANPGPSTYNAVMLSEPPAVFAAVTSASTVADGSPAW
jgi:hypothetical protein